MTDITTIEEVQAEDYTVRVARTADGTAWEAVVISSDGTDTTTPGLQLPVSLGYSPNSTSDNSDDEDDTDPLGPPVTAPHRWVAIGFAIEAYEWDQINEEPVDVPDGYEFAEVHDADLSISDELERTASTRMFQPGDGQWSGSMTIDNDDTDGEWFRKLVLAAMGEEETNTDD